MSMQGFQGPGTVSSFYLLDGFSMHAFSGALSALHLANETSGEKLYSWRIVSSTGGEVRSDCGLGVISDLALAEERQTAAMRERASMVVVCGGSEVAETPQPLRAWLRECAKNRIPVATLASGTFALARAGLFQGRRWAVHWEQQPSFSEEFPEVRVSQNLYEIDGDLFTCAGGVAAFDMFAKLVEEKVGSARVTKLCEKAIVDRIRDPEERQRIPLQTHFGALHSPVVKAIEQMEANLVEPLELDDIATSCNLSRRQLERLFRQDLGRTPARYYLELRLEKAALLTQRSTIPITDIAIACGFVSISHFTKTFQTLHGKTPQHMRHSQNRLRTVAELQVP